MCRFDRSEARLTAGIGARDSGQRRAESPSHVPMSHAPPRFRARDACDVCDVQARVRTSPASQAHTPKHSFFLWDVGTLGRGSMQ
ncbi:hypothetical protein PPN31114_03524 [Pandoraea pneumonica]|uniref:Uncharacterized protein n=1 Tax=Pandoraea pneumonica TaxID=2508299 RepID=A0A5E4WUH1_9BURK|nr:hypothetical protein PPN31114_03524 [Pandoraea pneumonica]